MRIAATIAGTIFLVAGLAAGLFAALMSQEKDPDNQHARLTFVVTMIALLLIAIGSGLVWSQIAE